MYSSDSKDQIPLLLNIVVFNFQPETSQMRRWIGRRTEDQDARWPTHSDARTVMRQTQGGMGSDRTRAGTAKVMNDGCAAAAAGDGGNGDDGDDNSNYVDYDGGNNSGGDGDDRRRFWKKKPWL